MPRLVSVDVDVCVLKCDGEVELWHGHEMPINVCNSMLVGWLVGARSCGPKPPPDVKVVPIHEYGAVEEPDAPENAGPGAVLSASVPCDGHG